MPLRLVTPDDTPAPVNRLTELELAVVHLRRAAAAWGKPEVSAKLGTVADNLSRVVERAAA